MAYYTCLLLDADNTLLDFDAAERKALADTLIHYELPHDDAALTAYHQVNRRLWDSLAKGELNRNKLFRPVPQGPEPAGQRQGPGDERLL